MVTYSPLFKIAIIYLGISIILYAGGVNNPDVTDQFNTVVKENGSGDYLSNTVSYGMSSNVSGIQPDIGSSASATGGLGLIEVLRAVGNAISFMVRVAFAIPVMFMGFPPFIQLFIGAPLGVIALIAAIYFVRSG
jgi:hypothetical protein